jgi:Uma2 family endonuclease
MNEALRRIPYDPIYPDSDGEPMAENTLQYEWIVTLQGGFDTLLADFVGGDLLWYPVKGEPKTRLAPDVLVVLGRPKGHRGSYKQWEEDGVSPTLVIEVMSPSNTVDEMEAKRSFYERHGVQEFVVYDPDRGHLGVWQRSGEHLAQVPRPDGWTSPSTGVTFSLDGTRLIAIRPDGACFRSFREVVEDERRTRLVAKATLNRAQKAEERARAEQNRAVEAEERARAEQNRAAEAEERARAEQDRAAEAEARATDAEARAAVLLAEVAALQAALGRRS